MLVTFQMSTTAPRFLTALGSLVEQFSVRVSMEGGTNHRPAGPALLAAYDLDLGVNKTLHLRIDRTHLIGLPFMNMFGCFGDIARTLVRFSCVLAGPSSAVVINRMVQGRSQLNGRRPVYRFSEYSRPCVHWSNSELMQHLQIFMECPYLFPCHESIEACDFEIHSECFYLSDPGGLLDTVMSRFDQEQRSCLQNTRCSEHRSPLLARVPSESSRTGS